MTDLGTALLWITLLATRHRVRGPGPLVSTGPVDDRRPCLPENLQIEGERPVLDVAQIEPDRLLPGQIRPAADLPQAGQARLDREPAPHLAAIARGLLRQCRPGPDQGHIPEQHVDELRKLVERPPAQPPADLSDPGIAADLEEHPARLITHGELRLPGVRTHHHGPELVQGERASIPADPWLPEQDGTAVSHPDGQCYDS